MHVADVKPAIVHASYSSASMVLVFEQTFVLEDDIGSTIAVIETSIVI
jgi:hypothetical protein